MPKSPGCGTEKVVKNAHIHNNKPRYLCRECGRQFVENPTQKRISQETKALIDRLLFEKISLAGIARVCDVSQVWQQKSQVWQQKYVNEKYEQVSKKIEINSAPKKRAIDPRM